MRQQAEARARTAHPTPRTANPWLSVRESEIQGRGVFAARRIPKGTWIIEYTGERISHDEADQRYDDASMTRHHTFLFIVDEKTCLDAAVGGNEARFINHSCEPNCEAVVTEKEREIWICALRDIEPWEELSYDYGFVMEGESLASARRNYPCKCGAERCTGTILKVG